MPWSTRFTITIIFAFALLYAGSLGCTCGDDGDQTLGSDGGDLGELDDDTETVFDDDYSDDDTTADDDDDDDSIIPEDEVWEFLISPEGMGGVLDSDPNMIPDDQAGVPGDEFQYIGHLCGDVTPCQDIIQDVEWSTSDEELATIDENGVVTLLDYGVVDVIGVVTPPASIGEEYSLVDRAVIYIQADILVLDRNGKLGTIDHSNGDIELDTIAEALPNPSEDFIVAGHHAYIIGVAADGNGVAFVPSLDAAEEELPETVILETQAPIHPHVLSRFHQSLTITALDFELVYLFDIISASVIGTIRMPHESAPFGVITSDINNGVTFIALTYEDDGAYGQGEIEIRNARNLFVWSIDTSPNPRYLVPVNSLDETKLYAICGGDQDTSFGMIDVFTQDYASTGTQIGIDGYPEAFAIGDDKLIFGDKTKPRLYVLDATSDSLATFDTGDGPQDYLGLPYGTGIRDIYYDHSRALIYVAAADSYVMTLDANDYAILDTYTLAGYDLVGVTSW